MVFREKLNLEKIWFMIAVMMLLTVSPSFVQAAEDVSPPEFNVMEVSKEKATVGDKVKITADISDDVSGVESVEVVYEPDFNDLVIEKSTELNLNSDTGKYEGELEVGEYDLEGTWMVDSINVKDRQGNSYSYHNGEGKTSHKTEDYGYIDLSAYNFEIYETTEDDEMPVLEDFSVSHERAKLNDQVTLEAKVSDNLSGVKSVEVEYIAPVSNAVKYIEMKYNKSEDVYEGSFEIGRYDAAGDWKIHYIKLMDVQGNDYTHYNGEGSFENQRSHYIYRDLTPYNVTISGTKDDHTPPELNEFVVSPKKVTYGHEVELKADVSDDLSGMQSVEVMYEASEGNATKTIDLQQNRNGIYAGSFEIDEYDALGNWKVEHIIMKDKQGNFYTYFKPDMFLPEGQREYKVERLNFEHKNLDEYDVVVVEAGELEIPSTQFEDTQNHWAENEVVYLVERNILTGYKDGSFKPDQKITRAEAATVIAKELKLKLVSSDFSDVSDQHWADEYIGAAKKAGILNGYDDGTFGPDSKLSRAEMATIVSRAYELKGEKSIFEDTEEHWAHQYIDALAANGITNGYGDGTFKPDKSITRGEFAAFEARVLNEEFRP
ncbi:S-layer homology domain-containing protein [Halobacillus yeomjeoni]|uniref:S-layer homology domain-containing protein n=1 Tax=Halobacillus yeomjeoni TaxID=311194 RepID=A0A931MVU9_9BACI|nr:S-layer homology domain-containing protein [Halobacillus yeomjeoni]MBH0230789.1 S-layer homology domain-containing protein [Halobacillus yeomjeoni]